MEPPPHSTKWPQHWQQPDHSNEVEHRLTRAEYRLEDHEERHDSHSSRLTWHERALQALALAVIFILQGKAHGNVPWLAELLLGVLKR